MTDGDTDLTIVRSIDAPRAVVWIAWTTPQELARWWWPERFRTTYEIDLRDGGAYRFRTVDVPGMGVLDLTGRFESVQPPQSLVYTWRWDSSDETESRVTVDFIEHEVGTNVRIHHVGFSSRRERDNHVTGWNDCLNRLEDYSRTIEPRTPA